MKLLEGVHLFCIKGCACSRSLRSSRRYVLDLAQFVAIARLLPKHDTSEYHLPVLTIFRKAVDLQKSYAQFAPNVLEWQILLVILSVVLTLWRVLNCLRILEQGAWGHFDSWKICHGLELYFQIYRDLTSFTLLAMVDIRLTTIKRSFGI